MNQRNYDRYRRYGMQFDPDVFRMNLQNGVNIGMPIKGRRASAPGRGGRGYDPKITVWAGGTEAPDEPARGDWMKIVASAGLAWDTAILQFMLDGDHKVNRDSSEFFGGVSIKLDRPRPPRRRTRRRKRKKVSRPTRLRPPPAGEAPNRRRSGRRGAQARDRQPVAAKMQPRAGTPTVQMAPAARERRPPVGTRGSAKLASRTRHHANVSLAPPFQSMMARPLTAPTTLGPRLLMTAG